MPDIYTTGWYAKLKELLNRNQELARTAPRGALKLLGILRGDGKSPYLKPDQALYFIAYFEDGACTDFQQVEIQPERKGFHLTLEIPAALFEGMAAGLTDPISAGLKGAFKIRGDMRIFIKHAKFVNVLHKVYAKEVETTWNLGRPPYKGAEE